MSTHLKQVTYYCKCTEPYGGECSEQSSFILYEFHTCDTNTILHKYHVGKSESKWKIYEPGRHFNDQELTALRQLLNLENDTGVSKTDYEEVKKLVFEF